MLLPYNLLLQLLLLPVYILLFAGTVAGVDLRVFAEGLGLVLGVPLAVVAFYAVNLALTLVLGRLLEFDHSETVCLACTTLSRNSPTALAMAVATFPHRPLVALALIVGPLVEVPLLSVVSRVLLAARDRGLTGSTTA